MPSSVAVVSHQFVLPGNYSLNMLKNTIIESVNLQE